MRNVALSVLKVAYYECNVYFVGVEKLLVVEYGLGLGNHAVDDSCQSTSPRAIVNLRISLARSFPAARLD